MKIPPPSFSHFQRRGVALVLTLSMLVIASVLLVGFITTSQQNEVATNSYARGIQAQEIAAGALEQVIFDLRTEIVDGSNATSAITKTGSPKVTIYQPKAAINAVPLRKAIDTTSQNQVNLLRRSAVPDSFSRTASPNDNSTIPSLDGRTVSIMRWDKPKFLTSTADFVAPDWIVVTRDGPKPTATDGDVTSFKTNDANSNTRAVGRYAYTIYDVGGLLNVNTAGFPDNASGLEGGRTVGGKESSAWADLTQIGLVKEQIETLGNWRNTSTWTTPSEYASKTAIDLPLSKGFTRVQPNDNAILSRQDLISYAIANSIYDPKSPNPTNPSNLVLPNLTTFSISRNSPSYEPPPSATAADKARMQIGNYFFNGKPLRRFPLNTNLAELSAGINTSEITNHFGLTKVAGWTTPAFRSWSYGGAISTMEEAVNAGREPNFFEIIKTSILQGSLGTTGGTGARNSMVWESNIDNQVIRIGANIIDQYDDDNFPTTIRFNGKDYYGIEDVPYFSEMLMQSVCLQRESNPYDRNAAITYVTAKPIQVDNYFMFELWNPHQVPPPTTIPLSGPTKLRIRNDAGKYSLGFVFSGSPPPVPPATSSPAQQTRIVPKDYIDQNPPYPNSWPTLPIDVNPSTTDYRSTPKLVRDGSANQYALPSTSSVKFNAFRLTHNFNLPIAATVQKTEGQVGQVLTSNFYEKTVFVLEYNEPNTDKWHPYTTLSGLADGLGTGGLFHTGAENPGNNNGIDKYYSNIRDGSGLYPYASWAKSDPRTDRMGVNKSDGDEVPHIDRPMISNITPNPAPYSTGGDTFDGGLSTYGGNTKPGTLVTNRGVGTNFAKTLDNDNVNRPADAYLDEATANPMTVTTARPTILNRPFRSVGEIGNAFRDQPWKTVNFFSGDSADAALLDVFCLTDVENTEGVVNLNSRNTNVLTALLSGVTTKQSTGLQLLPGQAQQVATELINFTSNTPLMNPSEIVTEFLASVEAKKVSPFSAIKEQREAIVRALASTGQTRTWNLMIDVIAQSGRFPNGSNVTTLKQFQVEGEKRYWMHVAIDRLTGEVIAKNLEPVVE